jgi:hypothetical protein
MLVLTYLYRIYPDLEPELQMLNWLETCRQVYNHALGERKDWIDSRKCPVNACSLQKEYIIPAEPLHPDSYRQKKGLTESKKTNPELKAVHSQVLQDAIGRVDAALVAFHQKRTGFLRFKQIGWMRSFLFPQMKGEAIDGNRIKLPKIGQVPINLHRPLPNRFELKEDLDFRTLAKGFGGQHMVDAGLGQFVNIVLPWVCWKRGVYYGKVDPRGTSQECPIGIWLALRLFAIVASRSWVSRLMKSPVDGFCRGHCPDQTERSR